MDWNWEDALAYYQKQGAPTDQTALVSLFREAQQASGGSIPRWFVGEAAGFYQVKQSYLLAVLKRMPSLRLENTYGRHPAEFSLKYTGCMRMCGKGPNIKWDGTLYSQANPALIRQLVEGAKE